MRKILLIGALGLVACGGPETTVSSTKDLNDTGSSWGMADAAMTNDPNVVEFRIPAATGTGAWNTRETIVAVQVGDILRIFNDDSINHRMHTNGRPCGHGPTIAPGASFDCVVSRTLDPDTDGALYDHNVGPSAAFWVVATEPAEAAPGDVLYERDVIAAPITDNQTTTHDFSVPVSGLIDTLSVHLRLTHTFIGDLLIKLRAPNGVEVTLHNRTGGSTANINQVYGEGGVTIGGIEQLFGADVRGAWRLTVADQAGSDVGTLDYLKITVARSFH